ncbi:hypothetical protein MNBD_NITROSPINAE01-119 [hydrothermal vent metagenome]|uniref:Uncharacterized protein n=1 Tax=hydrothermal vent metagenome TaxID=652676 RepID=A0A3B1CC01_9ZZZZ
MTGSTGNGLVDLSLGEFWENNTNVGDMTVLAQNHGSTKGWADNVLYNFHLDFNSTPGTFLSASFRLQSVRGRPL